MDSNLKEVEEGLVHHLCYATNWVARLSDANVPELGELVVVLHGTERSHVVKRVSYFASHCEGVMGLDTQGR
jgi:hypothetical protein